jgi:phosphoribosylformylglycinamidine cyclo-ligase
MTRAAYAQAGVDVDAGDATAMLIRSMLAERSRDLLGMAGFGAAVELPTGYRRPVLITATDGVGTKTEIARALGRYDTIGQDLVAMCVDDIVCHSARPLFFLDYIAVGRVVPEREAAIVRGIAAACDEVGCSLVGGETAEHPGVMAADQFDLAGFCVGIVERDELIDGTAARAGDVVVGLASSGLHANGYSLVRRLIGTGELALSNELLTPTRLYARTIAELMEWLRERGQAIHGMAHITGGGLAGNLPRAVAPDLGIRVLTGAWSMPDIFGRIQNRAGMASAEMRATFNCGVGFALVLDGSAVTDDLFRWFQSDHGIEAWAIGEVRPIEQLGGRYVEAG